MSHVPHELAEEFPEHTDALHRLKMNDPHFARLADEYHAVNREVHRVETDVEPCSDERANELRRTRMRLKDEIYACLEAA
jgi:uncharacterized protein YdcH (DUF465 family)